MDNNTTNERLARIEASLDHVVKSVDKAQESRDEYIVRLSRLEEKIHRVENELPSIEQNTIQNAQQRARRDYENREKTDDNSTRAFVVSIFALIISAGSAIMKWFTDV